MDGDGKPKLRILVADDNVDSATGMVRLMGLLGHDARAAHDGAGAVALADTFRPHVAFLDILMPGRDGRDVCRDLRAREWGRRMLIVAVTGWGCRRELELSVQAGFDYHLVKPIDAQKLRRLLAEAEAGRR